MDPEPGSPTPSSHASPTGGPVPNAPAYNALVGDWPTKATDAVETLVALLRDKTVRPATLIARAVIFGIIVFAAAVVTITLLAITLIRILTVYAFDGRVWLSDLVVGLVFVGLGLYAWFQRREPAPAGVTR
jgi:hypothetical protein